MEFKLSHLFHGAALAAGAFLLFMVAVFLINCEVGVLLFLMLGAGFLGYNATTVHEETVEYAPCQRSTD